MANIIRSSAGSDWQYQHLDGTSEVGEIVGQNAAATSLDIAFQPGPSGDLQIPSSKKIALPWELVQDSVIDIVAFVVNRLATRLGASRQRTLPLAENQPALRHRDARGFRQVGTTGRQRPSSMTISSIWNTRWIRHIVGTPRT